MDEPDGFEFYNQLIKAGDVPELNRIITTLVMGMGFSDFLFIRLLNEQSIQCFLMNICEDISEYYLSVQAWKFDLTLQYAAKNTTPIFQSTIDHWIAVSEQSFKTSFIIKNRQLQDFIKSRGYLDHYNIPLRACVGSGNIMLTVCKRHAPVLEIHELVAKYRSGLVRLASAIDYASVTQFSHLFFDRSEKSAAIAGPRPLMLLRRLAYDGLTLEEIAREEGISYRTAKAEVKAIKVALGTNTVAKAVQVALEKKLIQ